MTRHRLLWTFALLGLLTGLAPTQGQEATPVVPTQRRMALMNRLSGGPTLLLSGPTWMRNGDTNYPYRQDSDFLYVTGYEYSNAVCLLIPGDQAPYRLFVVPRYPNATIWTGELPGLEGAVETYGADQAHSLMDLSKVLRDVLAQADTVYFKAAEDPQSKRIQRLIERQQAKTPLTVLDPRPAIHEMRLIKDDLEIAHMQRAIDITCEAASEAMRVAAPGQSENQVQAVIEYVYMKQGAMAHGFPSIVGSGPNTTVLHYEGGTRKMADGELLLLDIGAEFMGYSADVSRTLPVNGRFTADQREIYQTVLDANQAAIDFIKPGVGLMDVHKTSEAVVAQGLHRLGLITDAEASWQTNIYMMYNSNHWLGLDVHDVGGRMTAEGETMPLAPGMVLTVEPGIYVGPCTLELARQHAQRAGVDVEAFIAAITPAVERYMNIGVRIEDDILVTADGHRNLSTAAPKTVEAIEALMPQPPRHVITP